MHIFFKNESKILHKRKFQNQKKRINRVIGDPGCNTNSSIISCKRLALFLKLYLKLIIFSQLVGFQDKKTISNDSVNLQAANFFRKFGTIFYHILINCVSLQNVDEIGKYTFKFCYYHLLKNNLYCLNNSP